LRVWLLGRFEVSAGSRVIGEDGWRLRKAASLVKLLALAPHHRLHREQTMELLWPDLAPGAAANNLHQTLHAARRTLEPDAAVFRYLVLRDELLFLCPHGELWVDVDAFEGAAAEARRSREPAAYRRALDLYAGDLLPRDRYEEWAEARRSELRGTYQALLLELAALHEEDGDFDRAIAALQKIVAGDPAHEETHAALMRLYARSGQRYQALRQYEQLRQALRRELGAEPHAASRRAYEDVLAGRVPEANLPANRPAREPREGRTHNLPGSLKSFVGRERERDEVGRLLGTTRLLTLTGPGGCGKTRLAQQVATDLADAYPDGVRLAELAPLTDPESVPQAVADALSVHESPGGSPVDTLKEALREKDLLLLLDNCEHLVETVARLAETLLKGCPGLRILATSREALGVAGEVILQVPPLSGPAPGERLSAEELEGYEAARLFVQRARYRNPAFVLTPHNAGAVAEICARLESIPLAIELAAARIGLSVEQVADRLDDSLGLLTTGGRTAVARQRTLRGTLDWSYDLLSGPERALFRRLSVFAGGWTLEAAEVVGPDDELEAADVLDVLSQLVDKSLVAAEATGDGAVRYRMLEPVRQYARERLLRDDEREAARRRHAGWCLSFVEDAEAGLRGTEQASWVGRTRHENANVRAALGWSLEAEPETALRLAAMMGYFWYRYGHIAEGHRWLEAVLARTEAFETSMRARVLRLAGVLAEESGLYGRAQELHERGLALYRRLQEKQGVAASLTSLGALMFAVGDLDRAVALTRESLALKRELGDERGLMSSRNNLGEMLQAAGDLAGAQALFEENLESDRRLADEWGSGVTLLNLGTLAVEQGEPDRAEILLLEALRTLQRFGDEDAVAECLDSLAAAAGARGEHRRAATLFGAAEAAREALGTPIRPVERDRYERFVAAARRDLNERSWASAWSAGRALSLQQAAEHALFSEDQLPSATGAPSAEPRTGPAPASLTPQEHEVALLAARGLSNRCISEKLSISQNTAATHVGRVLKKLGLRSRSQIGARLLREHPD
jgi:predicted ATPase/DNA-binding SARP family transcriptional activator/DNA-binding CsgD family transcriptional regulator